jgi:uncharacterized lipoprotein
MKIILQMMKNKQTNKLTAIFSFLLLFGLSACNSTPSHIIIAPQLMNTTSIIYSNKQLNFSVVDNRIANHVVQILKANQAAQLFSSQDNLQKTIHTTLSQVLKKQGLVLTDLAIDKNDINKLTIYIDNALISVQQDTLKYKANNKITLRVVVTNQAQTLTKNFTTRGNSNGPLTADLAVLERDFNQQLSQLLTQILNNAELATAIKSSK